MCIRDRGLKSSDYVVENMVWDGEPYMAAGGEVCRDAVAVGKKRVADYRVVYAGQIVRTIPERYCLKTVYELNIPVREPSVSVIRETTSEAVSYTHLRYGSAGSMVFSQAAQATISPNRRTSSVTRCGPDF